MSLQVNIADVAASAAAVVGHGEDVATKHAAAAGRIDSALIGWHGASAQAMSALSEQWLTTTAALVNRLSDHAQGLHASAEGFAEMEQRHSDALAAPAQAANALTGQAGG
ncbi:WXG100 family type VII secretion target [Mycolicibacterium sphagni]|uniref:WXG100 family type VII secretion target n=1 Tax=Mycolicibacterium sphagni TaxID=1786 RepID=UPI0021F3926D|nr:WXG100 family type VII secretion target [Mycolicibacterium sphagni]MCV7179928.1 WXG100 family type VII secretion target [Mycolicibacterium sphagni]